MKLRLTILWVLLGVWRAQTLANVNDISVGFDLKFSYGTSAISYLNGTVVEIARVDGDQAYQDTLRKLSLWSSVHDAPPYSTPGQRWNDWPRQQERKTRKAAGLPASEDVGNISTVIRALKEETERVLGIPITSAAASVPVFPALYDEDLYDSFEYVGLDYIQLVDSSYSGPCLTYEPMSALAAYGFAMCPDIENPQKCWEGDGYYHEIYYVVDYTRTSLHAYHVSTFAQGAYSIKVAWEDDLDLGSGAQHAGPDESYYWEQVRRVLLEPLLVMSYARPMKIILVGESSDDPAFRAHFNEVIKEFFKDGDMPPIFGQDPVYLQAKGVAEFVRRSVYLPKPRKPEAVDPRAATGPHIAEVGKESVQNVLSSEL